MHLRVLLPLAAVLVFAAPASASTQTDYTVTIEGTGSYARADRHALPDGTWKQDNAAEFTFRSTIPNVSFVDRRVVTTQAATASGTVPSASTDISIPQPNGKPPKTGSCSAPRVVSPPTPGVISGEVEQPEGAQAEGVFLRVLDGMYVHLEQCTGNAGPVPNAFSFGAVAGRNHPFEQFFEMPHEAIAMGKVIQLLDKRVSGANCPGYNELITETCTLTWKATVTFSRTFHVEVSEPVIRPVPAPAPAPAPVPAPGPVPSLEEIFIPLPGDPARLERGAASATVPVRCATACSGDVRVFAKGAGARAAAPTKPLARKAFRAAADKRVAVRVRFGAKARRAIRRAGGVRIVVTARDTGGRAQRQTLTARLR